MLHIVNDNVETTQGGAQIYIDNQRHPRVFTIEDEFVSCIIIRRLHPRASAIN